MDLAIVLDLRVRTERMEGLLRRPFGDADLMEIALEKLVALDVPVPRVVLAEGAEDRARVRAHPGLRLLRQPGAVCDLAQPRASFSCLARLDQGRVLWLNPRYPLLDGDRWWQAVEDQQAEPDRGLVSARRVSGPFFDPSSLELGRERELLAACDAFMIFRPEEARQRDRLFARAPRVFELDEEEARGIRGLDDLAAAEAIWLRGRLALSV